jgi:hypothetical protein
MIQLSSQVSSDCPFKKESVRVIKKMIIRTVHCVDTLNRDRACRINLGICMYKYYSCCLTHM